MHTLRAFFIRDIRVEFSYKFNILLQFISGFFFLIIFFFISKSVIFSDAEIIQKYGEDYFLFVSLGIIFIDFVMISLFASSNSIRSGQSLGYLEHIFSYRVGVVEIFLASLIYPAIRNIFRATLYLFLLGIVFLDNIDLIDLIDLILALTLTFIPFIGVGMISMAFIIYFKIGNPINLFASVISTLFSGIFYPVEVMPLWATKISNLIPLTYGVEFLRSRIILSTPYEELLGHLIILVIFSLIFIILGVQTLRYSFNLSRHKGTISDY